MNRTVLLTTIPSDSHSWPLVHIEMVLREYGYEVQTLGTCVPYEVTVQSARELDPCLVVVSTVNGHGYLESVELARQLAGLKSRRRFRLLAGGKLGTSQDLEAEHAREVTEAGFDKVYVGSNALEEFKVFLAEYRGLASTVEAATQGRQ